MSTDLCPLISRPVPPAERPPLSPERLNHSFTLPGGPEAAGIACDNARTSLRAHGLRGIEVPVLQVVSELTTAASLFAPGQALYISLRWRDDESLRTVVWDPHPRTHAAADATATCIGHRERLLIPLIRIVRECGGLWGFSEPAPATEGTRVWANLPRSGAAAYARRLRERPEPYGPVTEHERAAVRRELDDLDAEHERRLR
ncbi:ATP-binding protein [Streptomyces sp. NPDC002537]